MPASSSNTLTGSRVLCACLLLLCSRLTMAGGISIQHVNIHLQNGVYMLDATLDYDLGTEALKALRSGVPLTFGLTVRVIQKRRYLWNETIARLKQNYRIAYHALSQRYLVSNLTLGSRESFHNLDKALLALGRIHALPVIEQERLPDPHGHELEMKVELNTENLPAPLQPIAYLSPQWWLSSPWHSEALAP